MERTKRPERTLFNLTRAFIMMVIYIVCSGLILLGNLSARLVKLPFSIVISILRFIAKIIGGEIHDWLEKSK